jgi:hypothetical protein
VSLRDRLRASRGLAAAAGFAGTIAPPVLWAYAAVTLTDEQWAGLTPADRRIVAVAAPLVPLLTLAGVVEAVAGLATGHLRGDLLWLFLATLVAAFGAAIALRSVLLRLPPPS